MGSLLTIERIDSLNKDLARQEIEDIKENMIREGGEDIYAGHWGCKEDGIRFVDKVFDTYNEAEEYICNNSSKYDPIVVVSVKTNSKVSDIKSSDTRLNKLNTELENLKKDKKDFIVSCLENRKKTRKTATCKKCGKHSKIENVTYSSQCPHCKNTFFYLSKTEGNRLPILDKRISSKNKEIAARQRALKIDDNSVEKLLKEFNELNSKISKEIREVERKKKETEFCTCKRCKSRVNTSWLWNNDNRQGGLTCPICRSELIGNDKKNLKIRKLQSQLRNLDKEISKIKGISLVAGGWCRY